jgi:hypothetical protein
MIWVAGRSPTLVSQNLKATTLTYLAIVSKSKEIVELQPVHTSKDTKHRVSKA